MFHTFEYRAGYYIHVAVDAQGERVQWQNPNLDVIPANSVHGAKCAITREIKRRAADTETC